jgi:hypothetical protein
MTEVEITISTERPRGGTDRLEVRSFGSPADALRACLLRIGDHYAADPDIQRLVDAVTQATPQ